MKSQYPMIPTLRTVRAREGFAILTFSMVLVSSLDGDVIDASLKVRLNFDAAPVGDVIADTSPAGGHPGTNSLATWAASESGRTGVMGFDGTAPSQITIAATPDLDSTVGTIAFWMKSPISPNPEAIIFDRRETPGSGGEVFYQATNGHVSNQAEADGRARANEQTTGASLTDDQWHHFAYVYDQSATGSATLFVDGLLEVTKANSLAWSWNPNQQIELGKSHDAYWSGYTGFLDDFRIYDRPLTSAEVANIVGLAPAPQIVLSASGQPADLTIIDKDTASFTVTATLLNGDPAQLSYQWQKDGVDIPNATSATYAFTATTADNSKKFRVRLTAPGAANVISNEVTLTVVPEVVLIYNFDSAPVGDVIVDSTPNAAKHDGVNVGATWVANEDGRTGVMAFDGTLPSQITIAPAPEFDVGRGTIAFWMKSPISPSPEAIIFDRRETPGSGGEVIYQAPDGHINNQAEAAGRARANEQTTAESLTDDQWHHFAYVYDQSATGSVTFYVDGVLAVTKTNSRAWSWNPAQQIELGKSHDAYWSGYTGSLDEFRMYNRVLSASEISQLAGSSALPVLNISVSGNTVTLSWSGSGFVLQENNTLRNPPGWTNVLNGSTSPVVVQISTTGVHFFRLSKP
jgi:Concanavalin A-like lectin/glucanases superfamily